MVRGTRLARSATRARAHRASRHRLRLTLRPSLIHAPQDCINARRRRGERHGRRAGALARAAAPPRAFASSGTALHCSRPHGRRRQRFWFPPLCPPAQVCSGRGDLVGQDDDAAAGDACADAACADARLAMLPRPHLRLSRPKPWGGPTGRIGPARPPTHDARSVGAVKAHPGSVSVTVVRAVRSLADSTLLSYEID